MKILSIALKNFQSYPELWLKFEEGLVLISGPTGIGKSTVFDAVAWCLYGVTAKGVASDQVVSWGGKGTTGSITLEVNGSLFHIARSRSPNKLELQLIGIFETQHIIGKDLKETQELINDNLGVDYDSFVAGSYFNATSPVCTFFLDKAKERRELFEKLTDLSFPDALREKSGEMSKSLKNEVWELELARSRSAAKYSSLVTTLERTLENQEVWLADKASKLKILHKDTERFADVVYTASVRLEKLKGTERSNCPTCYQKVVHSHDQALIDTLKYQVVQNETLLNNTIKIIENLESQKDNPHTKDLEHYEAEILAEQMHGADVTSSFENAKHRYSSLQTLQQIASTVRASLLERVIQQVQDATNEKLSRFFDAELTVTFTVEGDNLNTTVYKGEYEATFKQLSKGQQQLLKLSFGTSVMEAVSESSGVKFENLFFDEALDGLDPSLKVKAFPLFQTLLEHRTSIMVIDHAPEFQSLFSSVYEVTAENGKSKLNCE